MTRRMGRREHTAWTVVVTTYTTFAAWMAAGALWREDWWLATVMVLVVVMGVAQLCWDHRR